MCGRNYKKGEELWRRLGRIFLKNSEAIVKTKNKYRNEFICYTGMGWCLTNIFKCNRQDYIRVLDDVYTECDESKVKDIEILFYYRIKDANMEIGSFETYPWFEGVQGATLRNYSGGAGATYTQCMRKAKDFPIEFKGIKNNRYNYEIEKN